jgi:predicted transcriptional regulator YheO
MNSTREVSQEIEEKFTQEDELIINNMRSLVKGLGTFLGKHCEIVLHSFKDLDHSVIEIVNGGVTGRTIGSPMTDLALSIMSKLDSCENDIIGNYYSQSKSGDRLKSITIIVRNLKGKAIGFLCMNMNLSAPTESFMKELLEPQGTALRQGVIEHYPLTSEELLQRSFEEVVQVVNSYEKLNPTERVKTIVKELYTRGIFNIKNGIDYVAENLGISRYTVYNYIRDIKIELE